MIQILLISDIDFAFKTPDAFKIFKETLCCIILKSSSASIFPDFKQGYLEKKLLGYP